MTAQRTLMTRLQPALVILIPAYEPDPRLVELVRTLRAGTTPHRVVVVDDGSGPAYSDIFAAVHALGAEVLTHPENRGKGVALKTGFADVAARYPGHDVVCADCDGQHRLADIGRVADALVEHRTGPVLGVRAFDGEVPARSRFGNTVTSVVFRIATGRRLADTQTGLRGYPASMLDWLQTVPGNRFEYELEALLAGERAGFRLAEVPIATIYLDDNASSHFRAVRDSIRVYWPFLRFAAASLTAFVVDVTAFFVLFAATGRLAPAVVGARVLSASVNYGLNHRLVFRSRRRHGSAAARYGALAAVVLAMNYTALRLLTGVGVGIALSKFVVEAGLALVAFRVQHCFVFRGKAPPSENPQGAVRPLTASSRGPS